MTHSQRDPGQPAVSEPLKLDPFEDFAEASQAVLALLQRELGMGLWIVTRTSGDDWIVLAAANRQGEYSVRAGDVLRWSDSFCSRMVTGEGPSIAPESRDIAAYQQAPFGQQLPIRAYMGFPLRTAQGDLFGTLCAIDPSPQSDTLHAAAPLLETAGRLLTTILDRELRLTIESRRREQAEAAAMRDELTGLWNRRAWEQLRDAEETRCRRYGHSACVLSVDLDGLKAKNDAEGHAAGDELLRQAAHALTAAVRSLDVVARIGGDEFAVLLVECDEAEGRAVEERVQSELERRGVVASVGRARRDPSKDLEEAWSRADRTMYRNKRARSAGRAPR